MPHTIRYGVIGCSGHAGTSHGDGVSMADGAELVACADLVEDVAREFGEEYGCEPYTDHVEMVESEDLDAVSVCTPSGTHAELSIDCMERGVNVLCEKPLDVYIDRVDAMLDAAEDNDVTLGGIFNNRTRPEMQRAREAVASGEIGDLMLADMQYKGFRSQGYYDSSDWRGTREMDGGCMMNQAIHSIDLLQWIAGGVERVYAMTDTAAHEMECEDLASVAIEFENGARGSIEASTGTPDGDSGLAFDGTEGSIVPERGDLDLRVRTDESNYGADTEPKEVDLDERPDGPRGGQLQDFVDALREGREPLVPGREAAKAVEVILASYASANLDRPVAIDELRDVAEHT